MKAIVYDHYGPADVLALLEVPRPVPGAGEVLVRVQAASINPWDWDMISGHPFSRFWGLFKPKYKIPGGDIAGVVEEVGKGVTKFKPGDEVFGDLAESGWGGFAEYTCAREECLTTKPATMTFLQAACIPQAGALAIQALRIKRQVQAGEKVLINGAGGGVGTFGLQIAKAYGAEVTVVDIASKLDMLKSLGADHVIDYTVEDFTRNGRRYDLIIDVVSNRPILRYRGSLTPGGTFFMIGGQMSPLLQAMALGPVASKFSGKNLGILAYQANKGLDLIAELFLEGKVIPIVDKTFPLAETAGAFRHFVRGEFKGKVVIHPVSGV